MIFYIILIVMVLLQGFSLYVTMIVNVDLRRRVTALEHTSVGKEQLHGALMSFFESKRTRP